MHTTAALRNAVLDLCEQVNRINPDMPLGEGFYANLQILIGRTLDAVEASIKEEEQCAR